MQEARRIIKNALHIDVKGLDIFRPVLHRAPMATAPQKATIWEDHAAVAETTIPCALAKGALAHVIKAVVIA